MPFKQTNNRYPEGIETLDLETAFRHADNSIEYVRIGVLPKDASGETGTISIEFVHFSTDWKCTALQACLLDSEIDMLIDGLVEAKKRMSDLNAKIQ